MRHSWWEEPPRPRAAAEEPRGMIGGQVRLELGREPRAVGGAEAVRSPWRAGKSPEGHHCDQET